MKRFQEKGEDLALGFWCCNVIVNQCLQTYARVLSALAEDSPVLGSQSVPKSCSERGHTDKMSNRPIPLSYYLYGYYPSIKQRVGICLCGSMQTAITLSY